MRRERIREKLEAGDLPRHPPADARFGAMAAVRFGVSEGTICSGCDEPIKQGETMTEYTYTSGRVLGFHDECRRLWEQERRVG